MLNVKSTYNWIPNDKPDGDNGLAEESLDLEVSYPPDAFGVCRLGY